MGLRAVVAALLMLLALLVVGLAVSALVVAESMPQNGALEGSGWELVAVCALSAAGLVAVGVGVLRSASGAAGGVDSDGDEEKTSRNRVLSAPRKAGREG